MDLCSLTHSRMRDVVLLAAESSAKRGVECAVIAARLGVLDALLLADWLCIIFHRITAIQEKNMWGRALYKIHLGYIYA